MRVLFSAHGAFGHVLPMVGLASALQDAGHEVRFATGEPLCATVSSLGLTPVRAGLSDAALVGEARRRWPETAHQPPGTWAPRMFTEIAAPKMLADLEPIIDAFRPDLLIREEGEHAAPVAAAAAAVPWVTHGWGSPLPAIAALEQLAERVAPLWADAGLTAPSGDELYGGGLLDPCPPSLYGEPGPPHSVIPVRMTALPTPGRGRKHWRSSRRLAYVGFGTVALYRDQPELIESVVEALLAHPLDPVVTTGDAELAGRLTALDPERVHVETWVSLPDLLPACDLVVAHGGAGTVLAALTAGVPLLLLPRGAPSQIRTSNACRTRGAAHVIGIDPIAHADLDRALSSLMNDARYRTAARELAAEIASTPGPDQVLPTLQTLAADRATPGRRHA